MKKIIILILFTLILTGCNVDYKLKYNDGLFEEEIVIKDYLDSEGLTFLPRISSLETNGYFFDDNEMYKYEQEIIAKKNDYYDIILRAKYDNISYSHSGMLNKCFEFHSFEETADYYYISAYGSFYCENEDKTTITLISDKAVLLHNAKRVKGNKYIWDLSKTSFSEEGVKLQISKNIEPRSNGFNLFSLILQLGLFGGMIYLYYYIKKNPKKMKLIEDKIQSKINEIKIRKQNKF